MKVTVVVPCRNERQYIAACVDSILAQSYPTEWLQVIVVDGCSDDGTTEVLSELYGGHARVTCLNNEKRTTPYALNIGIRNSNAEVVIIFGAHAVMHKNYVFHCVDVLSNDHSVGVVGGIIHNVNENQTAQYVSQCMSTSFGVGNAHFRTGNRAGLVDTVAFGAYRREIFDQIGYFDESLTRNQDDEFNYRVTQSGWKIYLDLRIESNYYVRGSFQKLARQYYQYGYWKVYVAKKHKAVTTWRQLVPFAFVAYVMLATLGLLCCPTLWLLWLGPLLAYLLLALKVSLSFGAKPIDVFSRVLVFFILHVSYGWGYWMGILRFLILRRPPASLAERSSR
jgi:glycosyltransferase involved in cell wall biosynthesis